MKRRILFLAFVLSTLVGWSQTVTLKFKNGTTQQYNMSELESIDFADGALSSDETMASLIVGVWKAVSVEGWGFQGDENDIGEEYCIFEADGKFIKINDYGNGRVKIKECMWSIKNRNLVIQFLHGVLAGNTVEYNIGNLTYDTLSYGILGVMGTAVRVSYDTVLKYEEIIKNYDFEKE